MDWKLLLLLFLILLIVLVVLIVVAVRKKTSKSGAAEPVKLEDICPCPCGAVCECPKGGCECLMKGGYEPNAKAMQVFEHMLPYIKEVGTSRHVTEYLAEYHQHPGLARFKRSKDKINGIPARHRTLYLLLEELLTGDKYTTVEEFVYRSELNYGKFLPKTKRALIDEAYKSADIHTAGITRPLDEYLRKKSIQLTISQLQDKARELAKDHRLYKFKSGMKGKSLKTLRAKIKKDANEVFEPDWMAIVSRLCEPDIVEVPGEVRGLTLLEEIRREQQMLNKRKKEELEEADRVSEKQKATIQKLQSELDEQQKLLKEALDKIPSAPTTPEGSVITEPATEKMLIESPEVDDKPAEVEPVATAVFPGPAGEEIIELVEADERGIRIDSES